MAAKGLPTSCTIPAAIKPSAAIFSRPARSCSECCSSLLRWAMLASSSRVQWWTLRSASSSASAIRCTLAPSTSRSSPVPTRIAGFRSPRAMAWVASMRDRTARRNRQSSATAKPPIPSVNTKTSRRSWYASAFACWLPQVVFKRTVKVPSICPSHSTGERYRNVCPDSWNSPDGWGYNS